MKTAIFVAISVILLTANSPAFCEQSAEGEAMEQYVSRSEYERLEKELKALKKTVEQLQQTSRITEQQVQQAVQTQEQIIQVTKKEEQKKGFALMPVSKLTPGWERIRAPGWMSHGHPEKMNARIARVGEMDLYLGVDTVGRFQWLRQGHVADTVGSDSTVAGNLSPGFQTAFGNFSVLADFDKDAEVFFDVFIADRPHPDKLQGDEGYLLLRGLPGPLGETTWAKKLFDTVDIKVGQFELDFGDAHFRRSNNAMVQKNPLIGNYIVDPRSTEIGAEVFSAEGSRQPIRWLFGIGSGGDTGDFQKNHGMQLHGKLWGEPTENLRTSASAYWVDHSGTPTSSRANMFRANRSGGPYAGILDDGSAAGQVKPGAGQNLLAGQFDLTWQAKPWELYGHLGAVRDSDTNGNAGGTPTESWLYYATEGTYHFTPRFYTAARYSGATALSLVASADSSRDVNSDGVVHRFQVGGGYWLTNTVLAKIEYVYQLYNGFSSDGSQVSGVDVQNDPTFNGVITEVSFAF